MGKTSEQYWRDRETHHIKYKQKDVVKIMKALQANQNQVMDDIETQIEAFYGRYADKEGITIQEAKKRATKADIERFERKAKKYVEMSKSKNPEIREKAFTETANAEMRMYNMTMRVNRLELLKANIHLDLLSMRSYEERKIYSYLTGTAVEEYERMAGILGKSVRLNHKKMESIVNSSFLTASWSDRLWDNQEALRLDLNRLLNNNITMGRGARYQARELRKLFDTNTYNSERLLRTETRRVQSDVFLDSAKRYGIKKYEFIAEPTACDECSALDGKIINIKDSRYGVNMPPVHPHCMCAAAMVYEE